MTNEIRRAYELVLDDILDNGPKMFLGTYDAVNGNADFMYGICTVMEWIADRTGNEQTYNWISNDFIKNMIESKKSALQRSAVML